MGPPSGKWRSRVAPTSPGALVRLVAAAFFAAVLLHASMPLAAPAEAASSRTAPPPAAGRPGAGGEDAGARLRARALLGEAFDLILDSYVVEIPPESLALAAVRGMLSALDEHSRLLEPHELARLRGAPPPEGLSLGIDIEVLSGGCPVVSRVYPGSPADRAGLEPGDSILALCGAPAAGLPVDSLTAILERAGEQPLEVLASGPSGRRMLKLEREAVRRLPVTAAYLAPEALGYLRIHHFRLGTSALAAEALLEWQQRGLSGLVLDLRGNPGGLLSEAVETASLFVPAGTEVVATEGRMPGETERLRTLEPPLELSVPIVVLIDSLTASSAEILAGCLAAAGRARLLGEPSFGKRSIQRIKFLRSGHALKITTARFRLPKPAQGADSRLMPEDLSGSPPSLLASGWEATTPGCSRAELRMLGTDEMVGLAAGLLLSSTHARAHVAKMVGS